MGLLSIRGFKSHFIFDLEDLDTVQLDDLTHLPDVLTQVKKGPGSSINFNTGARAVSGSTHIAVLKRQVPL